MRVAGIPERRRLAMTPGLFHITRRDKLHSIMISGLMPERLLRGARGTRNDLHLVPYHPFDNRENPGWKRVQRFKNEGSDLVIISVNPDKAWEVVCVSAKQMVTS